MTKQHFNTPENRITAYFTSVCASYAWLLPQQTKREVTMQTNPNLSTADSLRSALSQYLECSRALFECPAVERLRPAIECFERLDRAHADFRSAQLLRLGALMNRLEGGAK